MTVIVLVTFLVLFAIGVPLAFTFIGPSILIIFTESLGKGFFGLTAFTTLYSVVLLAVPFFLLSAEMMSCGGLGNTMLSFAAALTRRIRGGLGYAVILGNVILGAVSGSSISDVAATCRIILPELKARGWDMRYSTAMCCACGAFAMVIPPSIQMIIFGLVSGASVAKLFLSGVIPGLILAVVFAVIHFFLGPKHAPKDEAITTRFNMGEELKNIGKISIRTIPAFIMPIIILGGIYSGLFTPTESATVAAIYAIFAGTVIYRKLKWKDFTGGLLSTANTVGVIFIIIVFVSTLTRILDLAGVPTALTNAVLEISTNKYVILALVNVLVILLGMIMDNITGTLLIVPLLLPTMSVLGVDPVHFGAFLCINWMAGHLTPPVAPNLFVGARISGIPFNQLVGPVTPFILGIIFVVFLTTYIPGLSLWLPSLID